MNIIFMGTPRFAVPSLEILIQNNYNVVAVVTAPDKPAGRGQKLHVSEIKQAAQKHGLLILQPEKLKSSEFIHQLKSLNPDIIVVVAFRMLPEEIWKQAKLGTINLHASLLPQYRGAAPINWAIINGERETGVTTFFINQGMDTGDILFQEKTTIYDYDNAETLHDRLMVIGSKLVLKTVECIIKGDINPIPQTQLAKENVKLAPKIYKEDCILNLSQTALQVHNKVRGLSPNPGAIWVWKNKRYKIYETKIVEDLLDSAPLIVNKKMLAIKCSDYYLSILEIQPENKKRMRIDEFLNGYSSLL